MGEIAEMMLDGTLCCNCGEYIGEEDNGYPTTCSSCGQDDKPIKEFLKEACVNKIVQQVCEKIIKQLGAIEFGLDIKHAFHQNIKGILFNFYKDEKGHIRNDGYEKTIKNNKAVRDKKLSKR